MSIESSPEVQHYLVLGEYKDSFYVGFRDEETNRFAGVKLGELAALGFHESSLDGVAIDPRDEYRVVAVRFPKKAFGDPKDEDSVRGTFHNEFAINVSEKMGGFVCPRGIETMRESSDKAFTSLVQAKVDQSFRAFQTEAELGEE